MDVKDHQLKWMIWLTNSIDKFFPKKFQSKVTHELSNESHTLAFARILQLWNKYSDFKMPFFQEFINEHLFLVINILNKNGVARELILKSVVEHLSSDLVIKDFERIIIWFLDTLKYEDLNDEFEMFENFLEKYCKNKSKLVNDKLYQVQFIFSFEYERFEICKNYLILNLI